MKKIIFILNTESQAIMHGNIPKITTIIRRILIKSVKVLFVKIRTTTEDKA
jgi:hypothetical protein